MRKISFTLNLPQEAANAIRLEAKKLELPPHVFARSPLLRALREEIVEEGETARID